MVSQNPCKHSGDKSGWFKLLNKWFQFRILNLSSDYKLLTIDDLAYQTFV